MGKWEYHRTQLGLGLKQSSLGGTFYSNVSKNHKIQLIFTENNNKLIQPLSTGEDRVVLAVGELERVPALTVISSVRCSLIIPDHERRALFFCYPVTSLAIFRCQAESPLCPLLPLAWK